MLDIIIINFNSTDCLLKCLESIYINISKIPANVFVYDNASKDNVERVHLMFPMVNVVRNRWNMGFAKAVNVALRNSDADYVLLLNPDTLISEGFFRIVEYMEQNPDVGAIGPRILNSDGSLQASARSFPSPFTAFFGRSSVLSKLFPSNRLTSQNLLTTRSDGRTPMEVDWVSGACMLVRKEVVRDIGFMDEQFFMYWEDADWCKRMWEKGWRVLYYPDIHIIHFIGASSEKTICRSILEFHKSSYNLFKKHSSRWLSFIRPFAIAGLSVRIPLVIIPNLIRVWADRQKVSNIQKKLIAVQSKDQKIKVLRMIARLNIGGPSIHVCLLSKGLDPDRFQSIFVSGKISPQEGDMSYLFESSVSKPIIITELQREISLRLDIKAIIQIFKILRRENPDIVHTHTAKAGFGARMAVVLYNIFCGKKVRMVHTFHGHVFEGYFSKQKSLLFIWVERLMAKFTDVVIAISPTQKHELGEEFRIAPSEKIATIPLGFDLAPFFKSRLLKGQFRKSLGLDDDTILIGIIGRLVPIKNHIMFFRAAKIFLEENPGAKVKFIAVGDGELREELERFCNKEGLASHVMFCGWMRDIPSVYADLDILALSSMNEGTPVSIIESMASSVPVIATHAGGVTDLLGSSNGGPAFDWFKVCERGILCRKDDAMGMAKGFEFLIRDEARENENRLARARAFVEQRYSEKRLINDIESLYLNLMRQ